MKIAYITSMFPCWSETFILNEIVEHQQSRVDVLIVSIKPCSENIIQASAIPLIKKTLYIKFFFNFQVILKHFNLFCKKPTTYIRILFEIIRLYPVFSILKLKSLAVFWVSPIFIDRLIGNSIDHIHAHFATFPALFARIINNFTGIPYSFTAHAHDIYVDRTLLPLLAKNVKFIATISNFNKKLIIRELPWFPEDNVKIVRCGIDLAKFPFKKNRTSCVNSEKALQILSVGRLSGIKGFRYLLDALGQLKKEGLFFLCKIIGDGPDKHLLQQRVAELGLQESVLFLGAKKTEEVRCYMEDADVFVLACATCPKEGHDGIPVVFMEAMALGTPVIGTALSGIPELIKHGETGLLAKPENSTSLRDTIHYFVEHHEDVENMRRQARVYIEDQFNIVKTSQQLRAEFLR